MITRIEGVCRRFLWSGGGDRRCHCPVAWDVVTLPKAEGDLGIKEALAWNISLFFKLVGDIDSSRDCIWTRWVTSSYSRRGSFWSPGIRMDDSPLWKGIIRTRDDVLRGLGLPVMGGDLPYFSSLYGGNGRIQSRRVYDVLRRTGTLVDWGHII